MIWVTTAARSGMVERAAGWAVANTLKWNGSTMHHANRDPWPPAPETLSGRLTAGPCRPKRNVCAPWIYPWRHQDYQSHNHNCVADTSCAKDRWPHLSPSRRIIPCTITLWDWRVEQAIRRGGQRTQCIRTTNSTYYLEAGKGDAYKEWRCSVEEIRGRAATRTKIVAVASRHFLM